MANGMFINVEVDPAAAKDAAIAKKLTEVCPVNIFAQQKDSGALRIVEENLDECTLCELCLQAFPGKVKVVKLYE
jgi:ferredoxin-like protein FixX